MDLEFTFDSHPSEEVFEEYAFQRLSERATNSIEEHLLICGRCQEALSQLDEYILLMKQSTAHLAAQGRRFSRHPLVRWLGTAGALRAVSVAAATAVLGMLLITRHVAPSLATEVVPLVALRGGSGVSIARTRSGQPFEIEIDLSDLPAATPYGIEMVDSYGELVWSQVVPSEGGKLSVHSPSSLKAGIYWVRLYSQAGELLREFGLRAD